MNFNFLSKNNIGVVIALLLVILLSQGKFLNFLLDTTLGRTILILFVLALSYVNKIFGVVAVLFIVIIFNQSDLAYLEGFTDASGNTAGANAKQDAKTEEKQKIKQNIEERQKMRQNIKANMAAKDTTPDTTTATTPATTPATTTALNPSLGMQNTISNSGQEGFDLIGKENTIKRGKQSNKISLVNHNNNSENIESFDGSFTNNFSSF
jgi:hypothetical protein